MRLVELQIHSRALPVVAKHKCTHVLGPIRARLWISQSALASIPTVLVGLDYPFGAQADLLSRASSHWRNGTIAEIG